MRLIFSKYLHRSWRRRVQILSDLHLEVGQQYLSFKFPVTAPFLLLAGDIGRLIDYNDYKAFLQVQTRRYEKVFLVLGNHEFYGLSYRSGLETAQRLAKEPLLADRLVLLHQSRWDSPTSDMTILGCTLWSSIPNHAYDIVQSKINDFKKIQDWTPQEHDAIHHVEVAWLREQLALLAKEGGQKPRKILVATHHAPCIDGTSHPDHVSNPWTVAFATDLIPQDGLDNVNVWAFGHTHYSTDLERNGIRVVSNQRGYVIPGSASWRDERRNAGTGSHGFDTSMTIAL